MTPVFIYCRDCDTLFETKLEQPEQAPHGIYWHVKVKCRCNIPKDSEAVIWERFTDDVPLGTKDKPYIITRKRSE
jgi:hypothetical protein